jgi:hypothetical protein
MSNMYSYTLLRRYTRIPPTKRRTMSQPAPAVVRIKRKRDEPVLPSFVLGIKRPALSDLSVDDVPRPALTPTRYKLVSTVPAGTSRTAAAHHTAAAQAERREHSAQLRQTEARYRAVSLRRRSHDNGSNAGDQRVLELRRCASVPEMSPSGRPKLRPFGPPLPPSSRAQRPFPANESVSDDPLADIWRDAAIASTMDSADAGGGEEDTDEFVFDEYSIATAAEGGGGEGDAIEDPALFAEPEIWWEDLDEETISELEARDADSDSQGEMDYPDELSEDDSDDDWGRHRR